MSCHYYFYYVFILLGARFTPELILHSFIHHDTSLKPEESQTTIVIDVPCCTTAQSGREFIFSLRTEVKITKTHENNVDERRGEWVEHSNFHTTHTHRSIIDLTAAINPLIIWSNVKSNWDKLLGNTHRFIDLIDDLLTAIVGFKEKVEKNTNFEMKNVKWKCLFFAKCLNVNYWFNDLANRFWMILTLRDEWFVFEYAFCWIRDVDEMCRSFIQFKRFFIKWMYESYEFS